MYQNRIAIQTLINKVPVTPFSFNMLYLLSNCNLQLKEYVKVYKNMNVTTCFTTPQKPQRGVDKFLLVMGM